MQENEIIGITGVFALTFCLIALYHLMSKFGRHSKRYDARTKQLNERDQDGRPTHDLDKPSGKDDAWLLWSPDLGEAAPPKPGFGEHRDTKGSRLRS